MSLQELNENEPMTKPRKGKCIVESRWLRLYLQAIPDKRVIMKVGKIGENLCKYAAVEWLKTKYKEQPQLFTHWQWVNP